MAEIIGGLMKALNSKDAKCIMEAVGSLVQTKGGMTRFANLTGLPRVSLYRILGKQANPKLKTLLVILDALDLEVEIRPRRRE